jgi:hypothetical protein
MTGMRGRKREKVLAQVGQARNTVGLFSASQSAAIRSAISLLRLAAGPVRRRAAAAEQQADVAQMLFQILIGIFHIGGVGRAHLAAGEV